MKLQHTIKNRRSRNQVDYMNFRQRIVGIIILFIHWFAIQSDAKETDSYQHIIHQYITIFTVVYLESRRKHQLTLFELLEKSNKNMIQHKFKCFTQTLSFQDHPKFHIKMNNNKEVRRMLKFLRSVRHQGHHLIHLLNTCYPNRFFQQIRYSDKIHFHCIHEFDLQRTVFCYF